MTDNFAYQAETSSSPSRSAFAVTPSDGVALPVVPKALYVGTGGHVTVRCVDDTADVVFRNVPSGGLVRVRALYVRATGTTASDIVAQA